MTTLISHSVCSAHEMGAGHPECPERLTAIFNHLHSSGLWQDLNHLQAQAVDASQLIRAHSLPHIERLKSLSPSVGYQSIDPDTQMNTSSLSAAHYAAGAGVQAIDFVLAGKDKKVFCAVRPPGHHAERDQSMGFCLYNNIAVAALHALTYSSIERVAIIDFDVHHGNGTVDIFKDDPRVLVCSSFEYPFYPGRYQNIERDNIVLSKLSAGCDSQTYRNVVEPVWHAALIRHRPDIIFVSAGFDAHKDDPLGGLCLLDEDYAWLGAFIGVLADEFSQGRVISLLEGGYDLAALGRSCSRYLSALHQR